MRKSTLLATLGLSAIMLLAASQPAVAQFHTQHNLVSDSAVPAAVVDPFLVNPVSSTDTWTPANAHLSDGDITALAVDPLDPDTLYAGTGSHGVFKSTNAGLDWSQTGLGAAFISALAVDPTHPGTLYAGTNGRGLLKSTDGGSTWNGAGPAFQYVTVLEIDPRDPSILLAGYDSLSFYRPNALFESTDGGKSWVQMRMPGGSTDFMTIDPVTPNVMYVITGSERDLNFFWKSTDWGETWNNLPLGDLMALWKLVVDPTNHDTLYGYGQNVTYDGGTWYDASYRSTDGGKTWTAYNLPIDSIAADAGNSGTLYAIAGGKVYRSTDRGNTWSGLTKGLAYAAQALAVSGPNPGTVFAGTIGGGVYKDVAMLTLDRMVYCVGESWKLSIVSAPANSAIGLMGVSNGLPWEWPGFGTTDGEGKYSTGGTFADGSQGRHSLYVEIGEVKSNVVSFSVSDCK